MEGKRKEGRGEKKKLEKGGDGKRQVEYNSPNIISRTSVNTPLFTGTLIIDCLIPIGRGQRELIIGDRSTGKTPLALTAIIAQKKNNSFNCILGIGGQRVSSFYIGCGIKKSQLFNVNLILKGNNSMWFTTIVSAPSSVSCSIQYLSPFFGRAPAEYFRDSGLNASIIYDDLTNQAFAYRQMSLLIGRAPGREAYPGDISHLHSRLLERASKMSKYFGFGSLTALPIVETQEENISAYIPTNVISITDGQIYLSKILSKIGIIPAVDINKSISRIGSKAQYFFLSRITKNLKELLRAYFDTSILLQTGQVITERQKDQHLCGHCASATWKQREFQIITIRELVVLAIYPYEAG